MNTLIAKAVSLTNREWVYGYPVKRPSGIIVLYLTDGEFREVVKDTVCYCLNETDKNGRELYIGDIVNDFRGGVWVPDTDHPNYHPAQACPPMKQTGDSTSVATIVFEEGTVRIETADLDYAYNLSKGAKLSDMEYVGNQYDHLIN